MGKKDWRTPRWFFDNEWQKYNFTVDAAADDLNALVRPHHERCLGMTGSGKVGEGQFCRNGLCEYPIGRYYTIETNGLNPEHYVEGDRVWCNPPYESHGPAALKNWLALAAETRLRGVFWELLLQPATDTGWFHRYVWDKRLKRPREGVDVDFLEGRIKFIDPEDPTKDSPPGPNMLVRFIPEGFEL